MTHKLTISDFDQVILDWIEEKLNEQPRLDDLADMLGYSKRLIQLHFKQTHGMTIGDYIINRRMYRACVLLRMTELPVSEIAHQLHFCSHHNFCRAFKKRLNCTPLAFRALPVHLLQSLQLPQINHREHIAYSIMTLESKVLVGSIFRYKDKFTEPNSLGGGVKLQRLRSWFQDSRAVLTLASDVERNTSSLASRDELINVIVIAGNTHCASPDVDVPENATTYRLDGRYLHCPFYGLFSDYATHNKDIYMHLLSKLHLKRREGCDIEFFYFTHHLFDKNPKVACEHLIPIAD